MTVFCDLKYEKNLESIFRNFLLKKLPFYYEPRKILIFCLDCLPITNHGKKNCKFCKLCFIFILKGKLDYAKIKKLAARKKNEELFENSNLSNVLKKLWEVIN